MKLSKDVILLLLVLVGAAGAGMWVLQMGGQDSPVPEEEAMEAGEELSPFFRIPNREGAATQGMQNAAVVEQFEAIVNGLLQDLGALMEQYREKRQTVADIIKPENMRLPEYVQENDAFARTLMVEMEDDMGAAIREFNETDTEMKEFFGRVSPEYASELLEKWETMKAEQLNEYESFFEQEREIFGLYRLMLEIYAVSEGAYSVDLETNSVDFEDEQLQGAYDDATRRIAEIMSERAQDQ